MPAAEVADPDPLVNSHPPDPDPGDSVLAAERAHLRASREFLRHMRENVLSLKALGGDPVSEEYLKADLSRRAEALKDLPVTPLFFGRLDYPGPPARSLHIGRRHVHDQHGHPMMIDWRAPVSRPFYRASPATPMGLSRRRRFGFSGAELTAYEDEDFAAPQALGTQGATVTSRIVVEEIERPRVGPMRDIVATIQPDQDDIVRADAGQTVCVQGAVILSRMEAAGEPCDDRTHDSVRRSRPVKAAVDATWPAVDPARLVMRLLSDPGLLAAAADGVLTPAEQEAVRWITPPRGPRSAPWSAADAILIDEAADLIERTSSLNHVVVDEAQDLSPMACRAIGRRCATGSATVLGDIAQGTTPWAIQTWPEFLAHLGKPDADMRVLDKGYRVPRQIIDYASRLLPHIAPGLAPVASVRQSAGSLEIVAAEPAALGRRMAELSRKALTEPGSVGVIGADEQVPALARSLTRAGLPHVVLGGDAELAGEAGPDGDPAARIAVIPVTLAKGLEFDQVIVVEPARITAGGPTGLRRLYVALTRAVSRLSVLHAEPLPAQLR